jgi:hypothetical protein
MNKHYILADVQHLETDSKEIHNQIYKSLHKEIKHGVKCDIMPKKLRVGKYYERNVNCILEFTFTE